MPFYSPLRYPGGKRKLSGFVKLIHKCNSLVPVHYVEPYAGGAAIALALLFDGYASHIHMNDLSRSVYAFWYCVLYATEDLCRRIERSPVNMAEWYRQREVQDHAAEASLMDLGFSTFFLNRTNRSGIITGGVIGGKEQNGSYKLNARFNAENLVERIRRVAAHREQISVYNEDASEFVSGIMPQLPRKSFLYLDPPYYSKGRKLYTNQYRHGDHERLAELVTSINRPWLVTYDYAPEIVHMYRRYRHISYHLNYSAAARYGGTEVMFVSDGLSIPEVDSPVRVDCCPMIRPCGNLP